MEEHHPAVKGGERSMRIRVHDSEVAAAFMGLARLRPDVVLAPAPAATSGGGRSGAGRGDVYEVGLLGSFNSEDRTAEVASLVGTWTTQLRRRFRDVSVEVVL
jgi:hypothetical protein